MKSGGIDLFEEQVPINDNVNHPAHYNTGKYESIDVMVETQGAAAVKDFCICNAFKYIYRHRFKNGVEDIKKAIWYLNKYVELNELTTDESQEEKIANKPIRIDSFSHAEVCDRPQMDCSLCWKESHCRAIEEAEREGK